MPDLRETENGRTYVNRIPPCGHGNGTHPSGCWYVAVLVIPVAAERARCLGILRHARDRTRQGDTFAAMLATLDEAVLRIIEGETP